MKPPYDFTQSHGPLSVVYFSGVMLLFVFKLDRTPCIKCTLERFLKVQLNNTKYINKNSIHHNDNE